MSMSGKDLKDLCEQQSLATSGSKEVLVKRLMKRKAGGSDSSPNKEAKTESTATLEDVANWSQLKVADLKALLKEKGLTQSGKKEQLVIRLYTGKKNPVDVEEDIGRRIFGKNEALSQYFKELAQEEVGFKANMVMAVSTLMHLYPYKITSGAQAGKLKGVGKSSAAKIEAFLEKQENGQDENIPPQTIAGSASSESATPTKPAEEAGPEEDSLVELVLKQLQAIESEDGATAEELCNNLPESFSAEQVKEALQNLSDDGRAYSSVDEDHFCAA